MVVFGNVFVVIVCLLWVWLFVLGGLVDYGVVFYFGVF